MTILIDEGLKEYFTDATPSWNGYNHQGKVSVFVVLRMINDLKLDFQASEAYRLELEWLEDFSILKNDRYTYLHQVKTYNETAPSKYKEAIWLLLAKALDFPDIKVYLHTTSPLSKLNTLKDELYGYEPPREPAPKESQKDENSDTSKASRKYKTPKLCHDYVKESGRYDEAFKKFSVYFYDADSYHCTMNDIEEKIKVQLMMFYNNNNYNYKTTEQVNRTYLHLLGLVDTHIRECHDNIQKGSNTDKANITFQQIYNVILSNYELPSKEYCIYKLRERFAKITNDYLNDLLFEEKEEPEDIFDKTNLSNLINSVMLLNDESFLKFCMKITPHHEVINDRPESLFDALSNYVSETEMTDGYLEILKMITREFITGKHTYIKMNEGRNISYLPTTIIDENKISKVNRISERILQNSNLVDEVLHEIDVIITKHINLHALQIDKFNIDIPDPDVELNSQEIIEKKESDYNNRITKIKKIRVIDINNAIKELDE